jgi:hypothetical protein
MLSAIIIALWGVLWTVIGIVLLSCVPAFRLTVNNLVVFLVGAFAGSNGFVYLYGAYYPFDRFGKSPLTVYIVGAVVCGASLVWLKVRIIKAPDVMRLS